jgi:hypothetical protein
MEAVVVNSIGSSHRGIAKALSLTSLAALGGDSLEPFAVL